MVLEARRVTKDYNVGDRLIRVLDDVSLCVSDGEFLVIRGSSGSGKSTLLGLLSGLDKPSSGNIFMEGRDITALNENELAPLRNEKIGFVFQSFHLVPSLSALENIMFPAELRKDPEARSKARALLDAVGLWERNDSLPSQLSGGEKQRVAICRALINDPKIVFADEPTGNLDSQNGRAVLDLLLDLRKERGSTLVLVTHSTQIAQRADRVVVLRDGKICRE